MHVNHDPKLHYGKRHNNAGSVYHLSPSLGKEKKEVENHVVATTQSKAVRNVRI